ncbi:MAG: DNA internalization-related competence protein ComEC/Rec2 [Sedimentibacter sp.]
MYILISIFAAYALGIISYEHDFFSYIFTALFALLIYNSLTTRKFIYNTVIIAFLILSFVNCNYNSISIIKQHINEEVEIVAEIKKQNKVNPDSDFLSYDAVVMSINNNLLKVHENTIIYVNKNNDVKENSIVRLYGNVGDSNLSKNKMLFNYNDYLRSKKIGAVIFAEGNIDIIKENYSFLNSVSIKFRNYTEQTFYNSLNKENADIILSVILGDVGYLEEGLYDNIKLMGLAHIFAVSGSHIVLLYGFMLSVLKFCFLSRRTSWVISWVLIWFYGFLIGFPLTVMRSLVMFTLLFGSEVFYRKYSSLNSIGLAALILTIYNPYWLFDAGFLLSFSAALSLIVYSKYIAKHVKTEDLILKTTYMYLFIQLFTLPVLAYYFNYIPVMGILYNLLLLPIFTVILIYGFLLLLLNALFSTALTIPFMIFDYILNSLRYIINFTEEFAFNGITMPSMSADKIIFFYIMLITAVYLYNNKNYIIVKYAFTALLSFYCLNYMIAPIADNSLYFNVVDAGQGLYTTIKYKNTYLIIDCGSTSSRNFGQYTALPYLIKRGITNIDGVFISHWDDDHYSGLQNLLNSNIRVKKIFSSYNNEEMDEKITLIKKDFSLKLDNCFKINILWPHENYIEDSINNTSLVILFEFKKQKILLTGDIEEDVEKMLLNDIGHADIMIVPHHGSKTSSNANFVEKASPTVAVISYGRNNYGMPSEEVIARYENEKSIILSTFNHGEINFILKGDKMYYNTYEGEKSDNYYTLYFTGLIPNLINFSLLYVWIVNKKGEKNELQNN